MPRRSPLAPTAATASSAPPSCRPSAHRSMRRRRSPGPALLLLLFRTRPPRCAHLLPPAPTDALAILREPMSAAIATVQDVSKLYGRFAALRHVSATLEAGRCYLLLGENGAGKSTLLRVLAGLLRPTLGTVRVQGRPAAEARGRIGFMSHAAMLYDELTARE